MILDQNQEYKLFFLKYQRLKFAKTNCLNVDYTSAVIKCIFKQNPLISLSKTKAWKDGI